MRAVLKLLVGGLVLTGQPVLATPPAEPHQPLSMAEYNPHGFQIHVGTYQCDLGRTVTIEKTFDDMKGATLIWNKRPHDLRVVPAQSGALRYEDTHSGLTWITIVGKSMLLNTRTGKQLANDCRA